MCKRYSNISVIIVFEVLHTDSGCTEKEVRLQGGADYTEGRAEICLGNEWGTVCDRMWGVTNAGVVCRQLGLASLGKLLLC